MHSNDDHSNSKTQKKDRWKPIPSFRSSSDEKFVTNNNVVVFLNGVKCHELVMNFVFHKPKLTLSKGKLSDLAPSMHPLIKNAISVQLVWLSPYI